MIRHVSAALIALFCFALPARATPWLAPEGEIAPIPAWTGFCERQPEECRVDPEEPILIPMTRAIARQIEIVNRDVNRAIVGIPDPIHRGVPDRWEYVNDGTGDCEDFQLTKRQILVGLGLPRRAMRMTVVLDDLGEGHAVLTVRTDAGDLILDNKTDAVLPWDRTGYVFVKREGSLDANWVSLGSVAAVRMTADHAALEIASE